MWIDENGVINTEWVPLPAATGPALRRQVLALRLREIRRLERELEDAGLRSGPMVLALHQTATSPLSSKVERPFVDTELPDEHRLEVSVETPGEHLGEELIAVVRATPDRWRLDVVEALEDLLAFAERRRPARERRDTVWRHYGDRHRGRRSRPRRGRS